MAKAKKRGPRDPTESYDFSVAGCDFSTYISGGTRRDSTSCSASLNLYGTLMKPIRSTTAIEVIVYLADDDRYRSIDNAPAYRGRSTQKPVGWLDLRPQVIVVLFLAVSDFDRVWAMVAAGKATDGHILITPVKWRHAEVRNFHLASKPIE